MVSEKSYMRFGYRKPVIYMSPYNYCDRWCEKCAIDKTFCLTYSLGQERELEAICDGKDTSGWEYTLEELRENMLDALEMLKEAAVEEGIDLDEIREEVRKEASSRDDRCPEMVREAMDFSGRIHDLLKENKAAIEAVAAEHPAYERLMWYYMMPGPKLGRIMEPDGKPDSDPENARYLEASDILSAQIAHKALIETETALLMLTKLLPGLIDSALDIFAAGRRLQRHIEDQWLSRENPLLEQIGDGPWWGPLEDTSETLSHMREMQAKRKAGKGRGREKPNPE